jgi:hypothetical protein
MPSEHLVVDGSNVATEGRNAPSLHQLEEAVAELRREYPEAEVTVIVDATFSHRIDPSELDHFEKAAIEGEYVHPPAGAIGRGDAFLLRIAEKVDAIVLSNDSFQEFHGEHPWLFERGRLLGATPVPGVGWIFTPRTPVRGPKSHRAVRDTDRAKKKVSKAIEAATKEAVSPPVAVAGRAPAAPRRASKKAVAEGSEPALPRASSRRSSPPPSAAAAVNDPLTFISFIAEHPLGTEVVGRVESYTSHGAVVFVGGVQCYVPLANMAEPPPRSAREVLKKDEERTLVVTALDPLRRGVELAVPGVAVVSGRPSEEMIAAEVRLARKAAAPAKATARPRKSAAGRAAAPATTPAAAPPPKAARGRRPAAPVEKAPAPPRMRANGAAKKGPASLRSQATAPARKATALPAKNAAVARPAKASAPSKRAAPAKRSAPVSAARKAQAAPARKVQAAPATKVQAAPARKVQAAPARKVQAAPVKKASPAPGRSAAGSAGAKKVAARAAEPAKKASAPGPIAGRRSNRNRPTR